MTASKSDGAAEKSDQSEGESTAVRVQTDAVSEQDTAEAGTVEPVESTVEEPADSDQPDAGVSGSHVDETVSPGKQRKTKFRLRLPWSYEDDGQGEPKPKSEAASSSSVEALDHSGNRDEESVEPDESGSEAASSSSVEALDHSDNEDEASVVGDPDDETDVSDPVEPDTAAKGKRQIEWSRVVAFGVLPGLALLSAGAAGFFKWEDSSERAATTARIESVAAAKDSTIALLSYKSESVEKDLEAAKSRLTGGFKDSYSQLIKDVVIPGAKKGQISTTATIPAQASVSATPSHAVVLLFVNQTATVDKDPPADTVSSVRVTLDKVGGRWLISGFDPV
jgi:Mce-associated membrane protein